MLSKHIFQTLAFSRHSTIVTPLSLGNSRRFSTTESTFSSDQVPFARAKVSKSRKNLVSRFLCFQHAASSQSNFRTMMVFIFRA